MVDAEYLPKLGIREEFAIDPQHAAENAADVIDEYISRMPLEVKVALFGLIDQRIKSRIKGDLLDVPQEELGPATSRSVEELVQTSHKRANQLSSIVEGRKLTRHQ
jgi:uncharacterized protein YjgD (DUF1641 family)